MKKITSFIMITIFVMFVTLANVRATSRSDLVSIDELPETTASFFDLDGNMGSASFETNRNQVTIKVTYESDVFYTELFMGSKTDMSMFNDYKEAFYYSDNNEKYIVINLGDYSFFTPSGKAAQVFNPHLIWNLNTNEYELIDRFNTYIHTELEAANNAYAYFYVDQFVIDNLLSTTLRYRYKYVNLFGGLEKEWTDVGLVLEDGVYADTEKLSWQVKYMNNSFLAAILLGNAGLKALELPALLTGTALALWAQITGAGGGGINLKSINEIDKIVPNEKIISKLNQAYRKQEPNFDGIQSGYNVFKLHLGQFNKVLTSGIKIDPDLPNANNHEGINIIEFTYMTEGEIYTQKGENINVVWNPGPGTDGEGPSIPIPTVKTIWDWIKELLGEAYTVVIIMVIGLIAIAMLRAGAFRNPKTLLTFVLTAGIFISVIYVVYWIVTSGVLKILLTVRLLL